MVITSYFSASCLLRAHSKAVESGKAGKALALPDFPPSVHFYINACMRA